MANSMEKHVSSGVFVEIDADQSTSDEKEAKTPNDTSALDEQAIINDLGLIFDKEDVNRITKEVMKKVFGQKADTDSSFAESSEYTDNDNHNHTLRSYTVNNNQLKVNSNHKTQLLLNCNHILSNNDKNNDKLLNSIIQQVGKTVFNGMYNILQSIINNANYNELNEMYTIIKNAKILNDNKCVSAKSDLSLFCRLPT
eukprot:66317_1